MTVSIYPAVPPSEVEWEELLVRYELTPRALRAALDDVELTGDTRERVGDLLRALVVNELQVTELFAAMRDARPVLQEPRIEVMSPEPRAAYERFAALRGRNFAAVQRRGLEVWEWRAEAPGQGTVTAHQLILASTALDAETLAGVREALGGAAV
ncbi:MAG TPA: hypothetical protein VM890_09405 [Longimicrobium sp.]|jgi:hypothetical protein|nr:hypothetical protein [Longimicrobium sp.]